MEDIVKLIVDLTIGDGYIDGKRKESRLRIEHAIKQQEYAKHKEHLLLDAGLPITSTIKNGNGKNSNRQYYRIDSRQDRRITTAHKYLYNKGRKAIDKELLRHLDARSLAYWFMDDGYAKHSYTLVNGDKRYIYDANITVAYGLSTDSFTHAENVLIAEWIQEKFGIHTVAYKHDAKNNRYRVWWPREESKDKLKELLLPYLESIPSMMYKLEAPHSFRNIPYHIVPRTGNVFVAEFDTNGIVDKLELPIEVQYMNFNVNVE